MVEKFGMSDKLSFHAEPTHTLMGGKLMDQIDDEILSIKKESVERATKILGNHKEHLRKLSEELNEKETLSPDEVKEIITGVNLENKHNCDLCKAFQERELNTKKTFSTDDNSEKSQYRAF